jgi:hypothetical protein
MFYMPFNRLVKRNAIAKSILNFDELTEPGLAGFHIEHAMQLANYYC